MKANHQPDNGCVVCGARRSTNAVTCDGVCRRAWGSGRSREQELRVELEMEERAWAEQQEVEDAFERHIKTIYADEHYNSPEFN